MFGSNGKKRRKLKKEQKTIYVAFSGLLKTIFPEINLVCILFSHARNNAQQYQSGS